MSPGAEPIGFSSGSSLKGPPPRPPHSIRELRCIRCIPSRSRQPRLYLVKCKFTAYAICVSGCGWGSGIPLTMVLFDQ